MRKNNIQNKTEYYRFTTNGNMQAYIYDNLIYTYYGYDNANSRKYKISYQNTPTWINGQPMPSELHIRNMMFYPNSYINFNNDGRYTKHYYNGMERIASRLGDQGFGMEQPTDGDLLSRKNDLGKVFTEQFQEMLGNQDSIKLHDTLQLRDLQPNPAGGLYYYHTNHLGSTCYVTDENASVVQGFLYAPFGGITNEYNSTFGNNLLPKYSFNAKELDEETGMYYYEARYMAPPVFISRDPLFEKYPTFSPYAYCVNNPIKYVDPDGRKIQAYDNYSKRKIKRYLKEHFGSTKAFRFKNNCLTINEEKFEKLYKQSSEDQRILLSGIKNAIKLQETALVKINKNNNQFSFVVDVNEEYESFLDFKTNSGKTTTSPMKGTKSIYAVGINDHGKDKGSELTTDHLDENGNPLKTTAVASTTFFHEVLDEFLNTIIEKNVTPNSPNKEKVYYQNAALRNVGALERNGEDHAY